MYKRQSYRLCVFQRFLGDLRRGRQAKARCACGKQFFCLRERLDAAVDLDADIAAEDLAGKADILDAGAVAAEHILDLHIVHAAAAQHLQNGALLLRRVERMLEHLSLIHICCVIAFPFGTSTPEAKAFEASDAASKGAREIDMVINVGAIKSGDWLLVKRDIEGVVNAVKGRAKVKVIIEACLLTDEEKVKACTVAKLAGAAFVKTSTGYSTGGATVEDVRLMRETVGPEMGVKASGGVRTYDLSLIHI